MARAYGANASLLAAFETTYGSNPVGDYWKLPFVSTTLGSEQGLIANDLIGLGRDPSAPIRDVIKVEGDIVVPIDVRHIGIWLKALLGDAAISGSGVVTHTFTSGKPSLPSLSLETGLPDIPAWFVASGVMVNSLQVGFSRSGAANATVGLIAHPDQVARTFVNVGGTEHGNYSATHSFQLQDLNGDGNWDTVVLNWARPHICRHANARSPAGNPARGDSQASTGLIAVQGQHYGSDGGHRNFVNATTKQLADDPTIVPVPFTNTDSSIYQAAWAIPVGDLAVANNLRWRVYNWGFTGLIVEGWGLAYMSPVQR